MISDYTGRGMHPCRLRAQRDAGELGSEVHVHGESCCFLLPLLEYPNVNEKHLF